MNNQWKPIVYEPRYLDEILEMSREQYGADNDICDGAFLRHQYFENPAGDALIELAVDKDNDMLAGQYVVKPMRFRAFGREVKCVLSLNTLTREAYRGQRVFTTLAECVYERAAEAGYAYVYGAPNPNSYPGFMRDLAFEDVHHFPLYVRPLDLSQMIRERFESAFLAGMAKPFNVLFPCKAEPDPSIVRLTADNSGMMDGFWQQIKNKYLVMGVRDAAYILHRYINVPHRKYHPYVYIKEGVPVAFAAGRVREVAGFQCGMIADFLYVPSCEEEAGRLVRRLVWELKKAGASLAGCGILAHTEEARQIKKCGFFHCPNFVLPQPTPIILRVFDETMRENGITDIHNWFFSTGDYDVV